MTVLNVYKDIKEKMPLPVLKLPIVLIMMLLPMLIPVLYVIICTILMELVDAPPSLLVTVLLLMEPPMLVLNVTPISIL